MSATMLIIIGSVLLCPVVALAIYGYVRQTRVAWRNYRSRLGDGLRDGEVRAWIWINVGILTLVGWILLGAGVSA